MPTVQEILDEGMPVPVAGQSPEDAHAAALAYGQAYMAVANALLGSYHRRVGSVVTLAVAGGRASAPPGVVVAVEDLTSEDPRPLTIVLTRAPLSGEVRVQPQADGTQTLTFYEGNAISSVAVYGLWVAAEMIAALDSTP